MAITTITNSMVSVNAIQGTLIADNAITAVHIASNAVASIQIAENNVTAREIAANTITVAQLADDCVESDKIADGVITTNHLNKAMISSQTEVAVATGDFILLGDTSDSNNLKKAPISSILAGTLTTAAQTNITSLGTLTALTVDDITIDGSTISDASHLTIDAEGVIKLDANGGEIQFLDGGTEIGVISMGSQNINIESKVADKDIKFKGIDGSSDVTALTLDMSDAGKAIFNKGLTNIAGSQDIALNASSSSDTTRLMFQYQGGNQAWIEREHSTGYMLFTVASNEVVKLQETGEQTNAGSQPALFLQDTTAGGGAGNGGQIIFKGHHAGSSDGFREFAKILGLKQNATGGDTHGELRFYVNKGTASAAEAGRFNQDGQLQLCGQSSSHLTPSFGDAILFTSNGTANNPHIENKVDHANAFGLYKFQNSNGTAGSISLLSSSVAYNTSSDYRLKENVNYTWDATTKLKELKPCEFEYKADTDNVVHQGFLAHEVDSIVPTSVFGEKDGEEMQQLDHSKLVPLLVKTIQELEARIKTLEG